MLYKVGKVISKTKKSLIFESNYTGYTINVSNVDLFELDKFQKIFLYAYENDYTRTMYGFKEFKERILFEDLLSVQGIGPRTAMSIISNNWKEVIDFIANGDHESIAKIPYVGARVARQIVFDFQKKYNSIISNNTESKNKIEVYKTLKILGFNDKQINSISSKLIDTNNIDQMIESAIELISHEQQKQANIIKT